MADQRSLFQDLAFSFIPSKRLSPSLIAELSETVKKHGGFVVDPDRNGRLLLDQIAYIISNTVNFEDYRRAQHLMITVVNTEWLKATLSRNKLAPARQFSPDPRMIFSWVNITCADIPETDKETIIGATMALGGMESKNLTRQTTHICALSTEHPKCQEALAKLPNCKIVLPHWFDDCFRLGKRIDESPYLLPDPEILRAAPDDPVTNPSYSNLEGATSVIPKSALLVGESAREKPTQFRQKKVLLSPDLPINTRLRSILRDIIETGDGRLVEWVEECDYLVCQYRGGEMYVRAAQDGKTVGSLSWLYYLIVHNEWVDPLQRLVHYPVPRHGIPGFKNMRITLSNYGGDARIYLEELIKACGAEYTKTMKADNTHLVTARMRSDKCEAARDWNIEIVNHLWVEESYAACEVLPLTKHQYQHFPPRTNLGEVVGQTSFDEAVLRKFYYPGGDGTIAGPSKKRTADDGPRLRTMANETRNLESSLEQDACSLAAATARPSLPSKVARDRTTPAKDGAVRGKGNDSPSLASTPGRSAKAQALSRLHDLAPDIALYDKEKKRSGRDASSPWGGKRAADTIERNSLNRSSSPSRGDDGDGDPETKRAAKKSRLSQTLPSVEMRISLSCYKRWVDFPKWEEQDRVWEGLHSKDVHSLTWGRQRKLRTLGISIVKDNAPCDYLAAPSIVRTIKFLRTLARGTDIISTSFIDACLETSQLPDVEDHRLKDGENEAKFGVRLETAIARARANQGNLLRGVPIYCTTNIKNGMENYKAIAEANGAIFKAYTARSGTTIKPTTAEEDGNAAPEPVYLLSSQSPEEKRLWSKFEAMARNGHMEPRIVVSDWLLHVAMTQQVTFKNDFLWSPNSLDSREA